MSIQEILNKLDKSIENMQQENFIASFPTLLENLEYIYEYLKDDVKKLTPGQQMRAGFLFSNKVMDFSKELVKQYFKIKYNIDLTIEEKANRIELNAGYIVKDDVIIYSILGLVTSKINYSSYIESFLHEARHKMQHDGYKEGNIISILKYPPHLIMIAKESVFYDATSKLPSQFDEENYKNLVLEADAEHFALDTLKIMLKDLFHKYLEYAKINGITIEQGLQERVDALTKIMFEHSEEIRNEQNNQHKCALDTLRNAYNRLPMSQTYNIEGQKVDKLIAIDKYIKSHPELQEESSIFRLIFDGDRPKTYSEIINDKKNLLSSNVHVSREIEELYEFIIKSDPILYLTHLVATDQKDILPQFLDEHDTIFSEYPEEIQEIICEYSNRESVAILQSRFCYRERKQSNSPSF